MIESFANLYANSTSSFAVVIAFIAPAIICGVVYAWYYIECAINERRNSSK